MTGRQEEHLEDLKEQFCRLLDDKYRRGAEEHGDNLIDCSALELTDHALAEAIDQVVYLLTLRGKLVKESRCDDR